MFQRPEEVPSVPRAGHHNAVKDLRALGAGSIQLRLEDLFGEGAAEVVAGLELVTDRDRGGRLQDGRTIDRGHRLMNLAPLPDELGDSKGQRRRRINRADQRSKPFHHPATHGRKERLEIVKMLEHGPDRHPRSLGDSGRCGPEISLFDQCDRCIDEAIAGPDGASSTAINGFVDRFLDLRCGRQEIPANT